MKFSEAVKHMENGGLCSRDDTNLIYRMKNGNKLQCFSLEIPDDNWTSARQPIYEYTKDRFEVYMQQYTIAEALVLLSEGERVRRPDWLGYIYLTSCDGLMYHREYENSSVPTSLSKEDFKANDWELVE